MSSRKERGRERTSDRARGAGDEVADARQRRLQVAGGNAQQRFEKIELALGKGMAGFFQAVGTAAKRLWFQANT